MTKRKKQVAPVKRDTTPAEKRAIEEAKAFYESRDRRPTLESSAKDGALHVRQAHNDDQGGAYQVQRAFGSSSDDYVGQALLDLAGVVGVESRNLTAAVALVDAIGPRDELEAALAQQMASAHFMAMRMAEKAKNSTLLPHIQTFANLSAKFQSTFTRQIDALNRLRSGGEQVVRHVHVHEGGQAIVAENFYAGGGRGQPFNVQAYGQSPFVPSLPSQDPARYGMPMPSDERSEAVPNPRRSTGKRRTAGKP